MIRRMGLNKQPHPTTNPPYRRWMVGLGVASLALLLVFVVGQLMLTQGAGSHWDTMPTRAPTPTPLTASYFLEEVRVALLSGDIEKANRAWQTAYRRAPDDGQVQLEGARLALLEKNLEVARERALDAVNTLPKDATAWLVLGTIEQRLGNNEVAQQAFGMAQALNPGLTEELFSARWQAAVASNNRDILTVLAQDYLMENPQDPLALYFRAEALLAIGYPNAALDLLLLGMDKDSPGVLWYTLGRAYLARRAPKYAITALDVAAAAYARGDSSLLLASADPFHDLNEALGQAYIEAGRCDKATSLLQLLVTPYPDLLPLVKEAQRCPQPTPTFTPWLPADWAISPNER